MTDLTYTYTGADAVEFVRAVLAAAGDTGHLITTAEAWDATNRAHSEHGARSMRERAAETVYENDLALAAMIRALPLLPDGDTPEAQEAPQQPCASRSTFMDGSTWRCGLAHDHDAWHKSAGGEREWTDAAADDDTPPAEDFDAGWAAGHAHAAADAGRIAALEALVADLADGHKAQSRLIEELKAKAGQAEAAALGVGKLLWEYVQVSDNALKGYSPEEWREFGKKLRREAMGEGG